MLWLGVLWCMEALQPVTPFCHPGLPPDTCLPTSLPQRVFSQAALEVTFMSFTCGKYL